MIFPALAIIIAKTVSAWLGPDKENQALAIMVGVIALTILFVNATPFRAKVTLTQSSKEVREIAAIVNLNTPANQKIGNYRLTEWNPKHAMLFYSNRVLDRSITRDSEELIQQLATNPAKTWLTSMGEFRKLADQYPNKVYLIQANSKYAFFTSIKNQENISYDFSDMRLPIVK